MIALLNISMHSSRLVVAAYLNPFFMLAWSHFIMRLDILNVLVDRHHMHIMTGMVSFMSRSQVQVSLGRGKLIAIRFFLMLMLVIMQELRVVLVMNIACDLVLWMGYIFDIMLNTVIMFVGDTMLDTQVSNLLRSQLVVLFHRVLRGDRHSLDNLGLFTLWLRDLGSQRSRFFQVVGLFLVRSRNFFLVK